MTAGPRSPGRLFVIYALASLVTVLVLGLLLGRGFRTESERRGLAEGVTEAQLIARTVVEPLLPAQALKAPLSSAELTGLGHLAHTLIGQRDVLRLRVQSLEGHVLFSDDGSGMAERSDDDALDAAQGRVVAHLTRLNADSIDHGPLGAQAVEVYLPLSQGLPVRPVGILEAYIPYAPIARDVSSGLHELYLELAVGLVALYLVLFVITASVNARLRRYAATNAFLAEHDVLTELPNRTLFHRRAAEAVSAVGRGEFGATVAIFDLDRFKNINDTLGHHSGDCLLTEIARRLRANMRPGDTVARLGGDEFGVVLRDTEDPEPVLWRLLEIIDSEVEIAGLPLSVQGSIGYATAPEHGTDGDLLLQRADLAMHAAKALHSGVKRYDSALDRYDAESLTLLTELRRAIQEDQLVLHYQPQVSPRTGRVHAFEALVRWEHPDHGLLSPDRFVPPAEQTDVIDDLTRWVLRRALSDLQHLAEIEPELSVAVNVSARSICRLPFATEVIQILEEQGVAGQRLIVEVTETALLADPDRAAQVLTALADAGIGVSLDDFGRGQTSLGYLSALPLDELKIDRSFVSNMLDDRTHDSIVRSMIDLGRNLGLRVVAEGVETPQVLVSLRQSGSDLVQGYLLGRPMPFAATEAWLRAATAPRSLSGARA